MYRFALMLDGEFNTRIDVTLLSSLLLIRQKMIGCFQFLLLNCLIK